jgi:protein TonB
MIANIRRLVGCAGLIAVAMAARVPASRAADAEAPRVVTKRVTPEYPDLARKVHAVGKVKLTVVVTVDGKVKRVEVIGGHPLLVVAATDAARQWLYAPASRESSELVIFDFNAAE